jgi:hypothetical protein
VLFRPVLERLEDRTLPTAVRGAALAFDAISGKLTIQAPESGTTAHESVTTAGYVEVDLAGQPHSSDPASAVFDPGLAGANAATVRGVALAGGASADTLILGNQSVPGSLTMTSDGALTVTGQVNAAAVTLTSSGLLDVEERAALEGGGITVNSQVFVNTGALDADGASGGAITVSAHNVQNTGRITADGQTGTGGTVQINYTGAYIDTQSAMISANGGPSGDGGLVVIDGGTTGHIFSSGNQEARGASGGSISLLAQNLVLVGSSTDASGTSGNGGRVVVRATADGQAYGSLTAQGVTAGGSIEMSAQGTLTYGGTASAPASVGHAGTLLLDPKNLVISSAPVGVLPQYNFLDPNPNAGGSFGSTVVPLSTGNVVVNDPNDNFTATKAGAVYLFNGLTGALISSLLGSSVNDFVGNAGITVLSNGNYVVDSPAWHGTLGAVTWCSGTAGVQGVVSAANSLVGASANDLVGNNGITALNNGNYVVASPDWNGELGAVTWGSGATGVVGTISIGNSLVGTTAGDTVGSGDSNSSSGVTALTNGNYVVDSSNWNGMAGAVTWGSGTTGVVGIVSVGDSLVGSAPGDSVGSGDDAGVAITVLSNGNYVVDSPTWNSSEGAVTLGNGTTGTKGTVSANNSLVGTSGTDQVGSRGVTALSNANYVVASPSWNGGRGAVTWGPGVNGVQGTIMATNSLVGSNANDQVGLAVNALSNGNYVVSSYFWNGMMGAVTWGSGTSPIHGLVSAVNSLVGSSAGDEVGSGHTTALSNGNYVVNSQFWNGQRGAATWGSGTTGIVGSVSAANSLVGSTAGDEVGAGTFALTNGNYVVDSPLWNGTRGAATWSSGTTGIVGMISAANSLVGSNANDGVGSQGVTALTNGNYVVDSPAWNGTLGAATWGSGTTGVQGTISASNSLVGSSAGDEVGLGGNLILALSNGNYVVPSSALNGNRGAVTWGNGTTGVDGTISAANSLVGTNANDAVGAGSLTALANGTYVVGSPNWANGSLTKAGAATLVNGSSGQTLDGNGIITAQNSLIGQAASAQLQMPVEDTVNHTFLAAFIAEGGGRVTAGLGDPNLLTFARSQSLGLNITPAFLTQTLNTGTAVVLQASNDITVNNAITVNNPGGNGGALTLDAGRSILLNAGITTGNGNLTLIANDRLSSGVVDAQRDPGTAVILAAPGATLNTGSGLLTVQVQDGAGKTNATGGGITLFGISAGSLSLTNPFPVTTAFLGNVSVTGTASVSAINVSLAGDWITGTGTINTAIGTGAGSVVLNGTGQTLGGNNTFSNLSKTLTAPDTLTFAAGSTQTITSTLTLQGTTGNLLALRSSTPGTPWQINPLGARHIASVDVQDSDNINSTAVSATASHNAGNNTNWVFPPGPASQLVFGAQPSNTTAGATISPAVTVKVEDSLGNVVTTDTSNVTVAIGTNPGGGTLGGTVTVAAVSGIATFSNLSIDKTGTGYTLSAADGTLTGATSSGISITPGHAVRLMLTAGPTATAGAGFLMMVTALDSLSNTDTNFNSAVTFSSNDPQAPAPAPALTLTGGVGYTVGTLFTAGPIMVLTHSGILGPGFANVSVQPANAMHLLVATTANPALTGSPISVTVTAQDAYNNSATGYTGTVSLTSSDTAATFAPNPYTFMAGDNGLHTFSVTLNTPGSQTITARDTSNSGINGTSSPIAARGLEVSSVTVNPSGFTVAFNKAFSTSSLNLYDGSNMLGPADLTLVGASNGPIVNGTAVVTSPTTLTYVYTFGVLPDDHYTLVLRSASNAFMESSGVLLDGNNSGVPGTNYTTTFTTSFNANDVGLVVGSFARGPAQTVSLVVPNSNPTVYYPGIPIQLSDGDHATTASFTLTYNTALISVTGAVVDTSTAYASAPAGSTFMLSSRNVVGGLTTDVYAFSTNGHGNLGTGAGPVTLGELQATIPNATGQQIYKAKQLLAVSGVSVSGTKQGVAAQGVQVVAYPADASGDGAYAGNDASLTGRVAGGQDTGFAAFPLVDPVILADVAGEGTVTANDASQVGQVSVHRSVPNITAIPSGAQVQPSTAPDPLLSIPSGLHASANGTVSVPVNLDEARPAGSTGLTEATLALRFDPSVFRVSSSNIRLGTIPQTGSGWTLTSSVDVMTGQIGISLWSLTPISSNLAGSLVTIDFHAQPEAAVGTSSIQLAASVDPGGQGSYVTNVADSNGAMILGVAPTNTPNSTSDRTVVVLASPVSVATVAMADAGAAAVAPEPSVQTSSAAAVAGAPTDEESTAPVSPVNPGASAASLAALALSQAAGPILQFGTQEAAMSPLAALSDGHRAVDRVFLLLARGAVDVADLAPTGGAGRHVMKHYLESQADAWDSKFTDLHWDGLDLAEDVAPVGRHRTAEPSQYGQLPGSDAAALSQYFAGGVPDDDAGSAC